ncbi:MAG: hypothetical protein GX352_06435 [Clostridiales bacterium]|nr:hypothetical protein [Clostridiales bacterium]
MKRTIAFIIGIIMLTGILAACGGGNKTQGSGGNNPGVEVKGPEGDLPSIIESIYEKKDPEIMVDTMDVDISDSDSLKYYTGLKSADKIKDISVSESMIGSQAYSLVLLRLNSAADAEEIAQAMKSGIDPRKWICVEADDLRVVASGDVVMLVMISSVLEDTVTADELVQAFEAVAGGTLTIDLK